MVVGEIVAFCQRPKVGVTLAIILESNLKVEHPDRLSGSIDPLEVVQGHPERQGWIIGPVLQTNTGTLKIELKAILYPIVVPVVSEGFPIWILIDPHEIRGVVSSEIPRGRHDTVDLFLGVCLLRRF